MMTNLFSVFDPTSSLKTVSNWVVLMALVLLLPLSKWGSKARLEEGLQMILVKVSVEVSVLLSSKTKKAASILITVFSLILLSNIFGLLPYVFTSTAHLVVSLSLALPLWLSLYLKGWVHDSGGMLAHLVPLGTPVGLMPFMVIIESISGLIRPLTLSVRLAANMIAGHLLLTLMSSAVSLMEPFSGMSIILTQVLLITLEAAVAAIQAYVFTILITLYMSEV